MSKASDYWTECVSIAVEECGLVATEEQIDTIASAVEAGHDNYGLAFYTPPASDRYNDIEREWKEKLKELERRYDAYRDNAEKAVKKALRQFPDSNVSIGEHGDVFRHDGRTERIQ
jgi:hypothetical protein